MPARNRRSWRRGSALLMVLWLSAGLAAIALSLSSSVRTESDRASTEAEGLRASYLASGALERAIQWTRWMNYRKRDGAPMFFSFNERRYTMEFPSGVAVLEAIPEGAKLSINTAPPEDLYRVIYTVSGDEDRSRQIVNAIMDWRSPAQAPTLFDAYYSSIRPTFRARHASFQEIEELLLVRGMSPELFYGNYVADPAGRVYPRGGLRDCLSVWGGQGPFDVNTASPALMEAVGLPPATVQAVVARRTLAPFQNADELRAIAPVTTRLIVGAGYSVWTLRATARLRRPDGSFSEVARTSSATVKLIPPRDESSGGQTGFGQGNLQLRTLRWYDDAWSQDALQPGPGMPPPSGNPLVLP